MHVVVKIVRFLGEEKGDVLRAGGEKKEIALYTGRYEAKLGTLVELTTGQIVGGKSNYHHPSSNKQVKSSVTTRSHTHNYPNTQIIKNK